MLLRLVQSEGCGLVLREGGTKQLSLYSVFAMISHQRLHGPISDGTVQKQQVSYPGFKRSCLSTFMDRFRLSIR